MKRPSILLALATLLLLAPVALADIASNKSKAAQSYEISWWTVNGGGATGNHGGDYTLGSTAGQPDAGLLAGGDYTLGGGFWAGGAAEMYSVYLPLVLSH
jgi:hypothetical protein